MASLGGRNRAGLAAQASEGWAIARLTPPSRLHGANGLRTGADGRIYVAQVAGSQVSAIDVDTGAIETISAMGSAIVAPDDLVFDEAGNLYLTEITQGRVSLLAPNGTTRVIHGDIPVANPITFHQGRLIAGELRMGARIMELDRDGGAPRVILDNVPMANAFEVGPDGMLYFPAQAANEIWRVSLDGGPPEVVARDLGVPDSVKFHPDGYIVSTQVGSGQVLRIDPRTGAKSVLAQLTPGLDNVTFIQSRTFVSHITGSIHELMPGGQARAVVDKGLQWPMGLALGADGTLAVADGMFAYALAPGGSLALMAMLFSPGYPGFIRGLATGGSGEWIVATANGTVARWRPDEGANDLLAHGLDIPMGVVVAAGGAVVVAESGAGRVLLLEDGGQSVLARDLAEPTGVAIGADGTVYVSESGAGRVVKLTGGRSETVLDGLGRPEGLALRDDTLFVIDVAGKQLVSCDTDGGQRKTIATHLAVGAPEGLGRIAAGGVGDMCGPMTAFTGLVASDDGTLYLSADAEGCVLALRPNSNR